MIKRIFSYRPLLLIFSIIILTTPKLYAQDSGKINRSHWENVTNGKKYYEKSSKEKLQEQENTFNGKKSQKRPKSESDHGYDPDTREYNYENREPSGFHIPAAISYVLIAIILIALLGFIVYSASDVKANAKIHTHGMDEETLKDIEENPFENDLERMIYEALKRSDYKLAIRLQFIYVVRLLSENGLITWKKHKTNSAYARELKAHKFSPNYNRLNTLFEHVWYGNWELNNKVLAEITESFDDSLKQLKNLKSS